MQPTPDVSHDPYDWKVREEYSSWSIKKFCRLTERFMEGEHMAPTHDAYRVNHEMLVSTVKAFKELHPRAYVNWKKYMQETYGFSLSRLDNIA
jgi:hypothetical protein